MRAQIEAVTVCSGYDDFLAATIPHNRPHFTRWIIVTTPDDWRTLDLCRSHNLEVITTGDFTRNGDTFNKGRAVERGLAMLSHSDWLLHIDADIALPRDFHDSIGDAHLDPAGIYGVDRLMVNGWDQWKRLEASGLGRRSWHCNVGHRGFPVGDRWADIRYGYVPIGFFQLWNQAADHRSGIRLRRYPDNHQDAARSDVKFALQWDRRDRHLIPEILVAHLESEPGPLGQNWKGRKSKRFGPPGGHHHGHHHHGGHGGGPCS